MTSMTRFFLLPLAVCALIVACDDRVTVAPPQPLAPPVPANARLVLSDSTARVGDVVTVTAYAALPEGGAIGSFTARMLYDSLQLDVMEAEEPGDGALRAVNPVTGAWRLAGASDRGLREGLLFRVKARVKDPRGLRRIALAIDELHSTRFAELTRSLDIRDGRAELLSGIKGMRVQQKEPNR
ncbi:MAG: hypothetical protein IT361_02775 [Gemmatimonadaceae bacterium]|nr:hypothetical protein [Gemmatimonadaceae bacterium]